MRTRTVLGALVLTAGLVAPLVTPAPAAGTPGSADPPLTVPESLLDEALTCTDPFDDTREPVLLVHGTFATDVENWGWNYLPALTDAGYDVCSVRLPDRSQGDIQVSSEYVVHAVREMAAAAGGRSVDILGHSQGGLQPRWLTRFYPETRALVDDLVTLATPHHGTAAAALPGPGFEASYQMAPDSAFITNMNSGDESPGEVSYTSIFTELLDELVVPQPAASTIAPADNVANLSVQAVCAPTPKVVDHVTIAADRATYDLVLDAFTQDGPADVERAAPDCVTPFFPSLEDVQGGQAMFEEFFSNGSTPGPSSAEAEPAPAFYTGAEPTFSDVPASHWAYWEVEWAATEGVATGAGGRFSPRAAWNRAQAVMWLWRLAGSPEGAAASDFSDVPDGAWYRPGLDWAAAEGIVRGFGDRFRPGQSVNRAQLAWWLWTYADQPTGSPEHPFTDVGANAWYGDALDWVAAEGIVDGFPGPTYRPQDPSSRAAVTRILFRLARTLAA